MCAAISGRLFEGEVDLTPQANGVALAPKRRLVKGEAARLEVLMDKNEPQVSYSWHPLVANRNSFSLLGFVVPLQNATATFSQKDDPLLDVQFLLDPDPNNAWAIGATGGMIGSDNTVVFEAVDDFGFAGGTVLTFVLEQLDDYDYRNLGRFRLSLTTDDRSEFANGQANGGDVSANCVVLDPLSFVSRIGQAIVVVPEPSTGGMTMLGLLGLAVRRRSHRRGRSRL